MVRKGAVFLVRLGILICVDINRNKKLIQLISDFFKKNGRAEKVWIFGSFSRGEETPESDVDLMVRY